MQNSFKKSIMFMIILLALTVSALGVTPALADDGVTPPGDAPVVEELVADAPVADAPVADALAAEPSVEASVVAEPAAEEIAVPQILEQLPEDSGLVVLDETGEALPLASTEAAEVLASGDPYFWDGAQYVGYTTTTCPAVVDVCNVVGSAPIQAAVDAFRDTGTATGEIFVAAGTYNENVYIDGWMGNLANLSGLIGEGSASTTINGYLDAYNLTNAFTFSGFTISNDLYVNSDSDVNVYDVMADGASMRIRSGGNVEMAGISQSNSSGFTGADVYADDDIVIWDSSFNDNANEGLYAYSYSGNVTLDGVTASENLGYGAIVGAESGDTSIWDSTFNDNGYTGLYAYSNSGSVMLDGVTASGNDQGAEVYTDGDISIFDSAFNDNDYDGLHARSYSGSVTLDGVTASGNDDRGAYLDASMVEVFCSDFSGNDLGLQGGKSGPDLYLNGVTFSGNASGDYENPSGNVWVSEYDCGHSVNTPAGEPVKEPVGEKEPVKTASLYTIIEQTQGQLPAALEAGTFGSALKVVLTNEGKDVTDLALTLSFPIPAGMKDSSLVVMFWNGSAWVEVSGGSVVNGFFVITVNQPGDYVLVAK